MRYPLRKSRQILKHSVQLLAKRGSELHTIQKDRAEKLMQSLQDSILRRDKTAADGQARELAEVMGRELPKGRLELAWEITIALVVALVVAIAIRQSCFEIMSIPTGSMRPTLKEEDLLIVSKTNFGIDVPLQAAHFYFDPSLVERTGIVVWSGHNIDLPDVDARYFFIIPSKKAFVKRLIGKPGDTVYFYGGQIWGIDANGRELTELRNSPAMHGLEHIPFQLFEGRSLVSNNEMMLRHFNRVVAKLSLPPKSPGQIYDGQRWLIDDPLASKKGSNVPRTLTDFFGIGNFGMARLLTPEQIPQNRVVPSNPAAKLYLQISHHPNLSNPESLLVPETTFLPLSEEHVKVLASAFYTSRFQVTNGVAVAYGQSGPGVPFDGVPDGLYEFYYGKPVSIGFRGQPSDLPADHPLNNLTQKQVVTLFNYGINFWAQSIPIRYAYFRDGDLYLMGKKLMAKDDPTLVAMVAQEQQLARQNDYTAFVDAGAPVKNGVINADFIKAFGLRIPEGHYLLLGDNHAMSADSRFCGPVPEENLMGAPSWIVLPHDERNHVPQQPPYPWWNFPRIFVWSVIALAFLGWWCFHQWLLSRPVLPPATNTQP